MADQTEDFLARYIMTPGTSLQRTLDAYGKGPFCASCHNMLYPLPPETLTPRPKRMGGVSEMEPGLKRLTDSPGRDVGAVYCPKGEKIVWATDSLGNWTLWMMNDDGSNKKQLTPSNVISGWPSWSPDGEEIAYWSWDLTSNSSDIWKMKSDGGAKVKLTTDGNFKGPPVWSPRGDRIAYTANQTGDMEVYIMNTDGSGKKQVTAGHNPEYFVEARVTWHTDGQRLYYQVVTMPLPPYTVTTIPNDVAFVEIYMVDTATGHERNLTPKLHENIRSVSPDGKKLTCISLRSPNYGVWIMDADGANQTRLTWHGMGDRRPLLSPDGREIVYWSLAYGNQPDIWMINVDGSSETRLTTSSYQDVYPSWSPDGKKIVFESDRAGNFDIWLLSLDRPLDVNLSFENSATQGGQGRVLLTVSLSRDAGGTLQLDKVALHFDWEAAGEYVENPISPPKTLSGPDDVYQVYIDFQVPEDAALGYHFYDVKVLYSEIVSGVAGPIKTYEHSAGDLSVGTTEQTQCDGLYVELRDRLEQLHTEEIERSISTGEAASEGTTPLKGYFDYLLKPDSECFLRANDEFYEAKYPYLGGDYVAALPHFQRAQTILGECPSEAATDQTQTGLLILLALLPVVAAILVTFFGFRTRRN